MIEYHFKLGNYEKCLFYIKRAKYKDKYQKALMLYRLGKYEECIREAVKIKTSKAYHLAGKAYLEMENIVKAVKYFYKSYQRDFNTDTLFEISEIYFDAGDSQRAIHYLREVLIHDEDNVGALTKIAEAYIDSSKWHDAIYHARKALEITKKLPEAYVVLAEAYFQFEGIEKALKILDEGLDETPDSARLWMEKGGYSYPVDMVAFHVFKKAIELKPDDCEILMKYIDLLMMEEEYEVAKVYYNQLLLVNPLFEQSFDDICERWIDWIY